MILEGPSFCITENKTKGKIHFKHSRLISKNAVQLFAESGGADRGQAEIVPVNSYGD